MNPTLNISKKEKGSALVYILIAIALLAALTATFMDSSSQQTTSQRTVDVVSEMKSQINFLRAAVQECTLSYPGGDNALAANPALASRPTFNAPYPLMPDDTYLSAVTPPVTLPWARYIRCPGNPGTSNNHAKIFGGTSGKFMPPQPKLFTDWYYYNATDGVYIMNTHSATDAFLGTSLQKLDATYSKCEADIINARTVAKALDTDGSMCAIGYVCFRVWLMTKTGAIFPDETGCP